MGVVRFAANVRHGCSRPKTSFFDGNGFDIPTRLRVGEHDAFRLSVVLISEYPNWPMTQALSLPNVRCAILALRLLRQLGQFGFEVLGHN